MRYAWPLTCVASCVVFAIASCGGSGSESTDTAGTGGAFPTGGTNEGGSGSDHATTGSFITSSGTNTGTSTNSGGGGPTCPTATTCTEQHATCGQIADGCGGLLECGDCTGGDSCGGGGVPSQCGHGTCTPSTDCGGVECGVVADGCGGTIPCGDCTSPETCGGGGVNGKCGMGTCTPVTDCTALGFDCGMQSDGCGGSLDCGTCTAPNICGANAPSVCGVPPCNPNNCAMAGVGCGPAGDGCGGILDCGGCSLPDKCGGLAPSQCGIPASCTNLCLQQVSCPAGGPTPTTQISGIVYAPNGVDPLPNVLVYVPNSAVQAFTPGVSCDTCASSVTGSPLVSTLTDNHGRFTLTNAPVGTTIPLVMQTGRWRRQVVVPAVAACVDNQSLCPNPTGPAATDCLTRLPRTHTDGDIPKIAFSTGDVDALECVFRKIGVADSEFSNFSGTGRIHLYRGAGSPGANKGTGAGTSETDLVGTQANLNKYDMVLFPCQGNEFDQTNTNIDHVIAYANAGGRVFATHYSYVWLFSRVPFKNTATWNVGQGSPNDQTGFIDQTFPKGAQLADWLQFVQLPTVTTLGQIPIRVLRHDFNAVVAPSQRWMTINAPSATMHYTFNTPVGAPADQQCGRVLFDDFHVEDGVFGGQTFPNECTSGVMTPQEKLLEFMIFDLGSCVTPDQPTCTPVSCSDQGIQCGPAGDGCGNLIPNCGDCPAGQTCGGGGQPGICGMPQCNPQTCLDQSIGCGPAGDGCGNVLDCGTCPAGQTCGGGGNPGHCGSGNCNPETCSQQGIECGPAGDGCGHQIQCPPCPNGQTCGGGGMPGKCGNSCTKQTCASQGFNCGMAGDGCGGSIDCGMCAAPQTCGGGGTPNVCGGVGPH